MINGFGLHRFGLLAIRFPVLASICVLLFTAIAAVGVSRVSFSGENIEILRDGSQEMANYDELLSRFRDFNNDAVALVQLENLATVEGIETLRDISFEYQLDERVESTLSIFSLVLYGGKEAGWQSALPSDFGNDGEVEAALRKLVEDIPSAQSLFSPSFDSAVIVLYTRASATADDQVRATMQGLMEVGSSFDADNVKVTLAGQPAIRSDLINAISSDLISLAPFALGFCALVAFALFRQLPTMLICAAPSLFAIIWFLGALGLLDIRLNFLTNVLPVLLIVIVFADTLHLYLAWQRRTVTNKDHIADPLEHTINQIGPACTLSALTTCVALLSLCFSGNNGLYELGIVGALSVIGGYVSVIVVLPLIIHWATKLKFKPKTPTANRLAAIVGPAMSALRARGIVLAIGLVICIAGLAAHSFNDSRFILVDYLSKSSEVNQSEMLIDNTYYGSTPLFAIVDFDTSKDIAHPDNENRVYNTIEAITEVFPAGSFYSLADFAEEISAAGVEVSAELVQELPAELTNRFISRDAEHVLVTIFSSANLSAFEMKTRLTQLEAAIEERGLDNYVRITGFPVLSGIVAPRLMYNLRVSLILAVLIAVIVVGISTSSPRMALACLVPNLLPIVGVELILWIAGVPLNLSISVALTVAFGIAVNDSVHLLNQYLLNRQQHDHMASIAGALREVTPAVFATTLILSAGLFIMTFSALPAMNVFAGIMIVTLFFAFLADIFQLPAYLAYLGKET